MISIGERSEPSARSANKSRSKAFEQQKWHRRPLPVKSKSAYRSKRQVSAPAPIPCDTEQRSDALQNRVDKQKGTSEVTPQRVSRTREVLLKELDEANNKFLETTQQEDVSESVMTAMLEELNKMGKRFVDWANRFVHRISACLHIC